MPTIKSTRRNDKTRYRGKERLFAYTHGMNVTAEKSAMRLKGYSTKWEHPFRHKLRMREARKIMAREEKDASKIGRMEGSGWQVIPNNPQYLSEYRETGTASVSAASSWLLFEFIQRLFIIDY